MAKWLIIEGTPEEKVRAIKKSSAFLVNWGFRPPVLYNVRVKGAKYSGRILMKE